MIIIIVNLRFFFEFVNKVLFIINNYYYYYYYYYSYNYKKLKL